MSKVILAWDRPSFTNSDELLVERLFELGVIDGIKTGHIADAIEDDNGVTLSSKIRSFVKDNASLSGRALYCKDAKMYDTERTVTTAIRHLVSRSSLGNRIDLLTVNPDISVKALCTVAHICDDAGTTAFLTTALTDIGEREHKRRFSKTPHQRVVEIALLALECGIRGVVCSGHELPILKQRRFTDKLATLTPGIRPAWAPKEGQRRIMTPEMAAELGATYQVIGTPILNHANPIEAATLIHQSIVASQTRH